MELLIQVRLPPITLDMQSLLLYQAIPILTASLENKEVSGE